jgi:hypothetical protein
MSSQAVLKHRFEELR